MQFKGMTGNPMSNRQLLVVTYPNATYTNPKTDKTVQFLDVQLNAQDELAGDQTNLHAVSQYDKSKKSYNNSIAYTEEQFDAIKEAAGDNFQVIEREKKDGTKTQAHVYAIEADLVTSSRKVDGVKKAVGLAINTSKEMKPSTIEITPEVLNEQFAHVAAVKEAREAAKAESEKTETKSVAEKAAEADSKTEVETPAVDEPEIG